MYYNEYIGTIDDILYGGRVLSYDEKNYENGILRLGEKDNFRYVYTKNNKNIKMSDLIRIKELKIPPIWNYCWISADPNSDIQVVGHDSAGRKQYLYTQEFKNKSVERRFNNFKLFLKNFPKLTKIIDKDSKLDPLNINKVISTIIKIILLTGIRAGKEFYAQRNKSYGITSLRKKHVKLNKNNQIVFRFRGKKDIKHVHKIKDKGIYNEIDYLLNVNDNLNKLFIYKDENDKKMQINEHLVNQYLHDKLDRNIVIKDLRTYVVNLVLTSCLLKNSINKTYSDTQLKKIVRLSIKQTAEFIQHTPSISKKSYMYPKIIETFLKDYDYFYKNKNNDPYTIMKNIVHNE